MQKPKIQWLGGLTILNTHKSQDNDKCVSTDLFALVVPVHVPHVPHGVPQVSPLIEADTEDLSRELPRGQAGELLVRGPWVIQER